MKPIPENEFIMYITLISGVETIMKKASTAKTSSAPVRQNNITDEPKQTEEREKTNGNTTVKLLFTAAALMLIAGCIFCFTQQWVKAALLLIGSFGCAVAALNFKNRKDNTSDPQ